MGTADAALLFSGVRVEPLAPSNLEADEEAVGFTGAVLKFFKLGTGDYTEFTATCLCLTSSVQELDGQEVFWHLRDFFYYIGWSGIRMDQWMRSAVMH